MRCLAAWQEFRNEVPSDAWIRTLVRNKAADYVRRRRTERARLAGIREERASFGAASTSITETERSETTLALCAALACLGAAHREVLVLFYFARQTLLQIAKSLGIDHAAARRRLVRARIRLAAELCGRIPLENTSFV